MSKPWISVSASEVGPGTVVKTTKGPMVVMHVVRDGEYILFSNIFRDTEVSVPALEVHSQDKVEVLLS